MSELDLGTLDNQSVDYDGVVDHGGMGGMRIATDEEAVEIDAAEVKEQSVLGEDIVGEDTGDERVLCHIILDPRLPANKAKMRNLSKDQIRAQIQEALEKHCDSIGWWPDGEGPDFVVNQRTDGVWHGWAKLKQATFKKVKDWSEFPRMKVDARTQDDIDKGRTTTTL